MVAKVCDLKVGELVHTFGDLHLYMNHLDQAALKLSRTPRPLPRIELNRNVRNLFAFTADDIKLVGYDPWPAIKAPVAV